MHNVQDPSLSSAARSLVFTPAVALMLTTVLGVDVIILVQGKETGLDRSGNGP